MLFEHFFISEMTEIRGAPHFFEVLRDRMNPEKNLRAIGLAQMGAEINFPT